MRNSAQVGASRRKSAQFGSRAIRRKSGNSAPTQFGASRLPHSSAQVGASRRNSAQRASRRKSAQFGAIRLPRNSAQ
eukprot:7010491-Alexandrium_andersonii.AAC.1